MRRRLDFTRLLSLTALIGAALLLEGCTGALVYGAVEGTSLNQTGKTASDHLVSAVTGQDCQMLRYTKTGNYCRSAAELAAEDARIQSFNNAYCYKTRGAVTCYEEPDPTASGETQVN